VKIAPRTDSAALLDFSEAADVPRSFILSGHLYGVPCFVDREGGRPDISADDPCPSSRLAPVTARGEMLQEQYSRFERLRAANRCNITI
jgi:hypothetical protein